MATFALNYKAIDEACETDNALPVTAAVADGALPASDAGNAGRRRIGGSAFWAARHPEPASSSRPRRLGKDLDISVRIGKTRVCAAILACAMENQATRKHKTRHEGGLHIRRETEEIGDQATPNFPKISSRVKRKIHFPLMDTLAPVDGSFSRRFYYRTEGSYVCY